MSGPDEATVAAVQAAFAGIAAHDDHTWEQIGRCVYCVDCQVRLYQGRIGPNHAKVKQRSYGDAADPKATEAMRARWGK